VTRLDDLNGLRVLLLASLDEAPADKRAPLAAQLRATLAEIDELDTGAGEERTGLSEFERRLQERSGATPARRASR